LRPSYHEGTVPLPLANPLAQNRSSAFASTANRRFDAPALLRLWHLASLDAPTVAVVWALGFAWAARVRLPPWVPVLLALVAWTVYIADRLLDAHTALRTGQTDRLRERHFFHHRHRRILGASALGSACIAAWIVVSLMPAAAVERNSVLAAAAGAYFFGVHSRPLPKLPAQLLSKEFLVGVLFTAACALPALSHTASNSSSPQLWSLSAAAAYFAALAWLNCRSIERWESVDKRSQVSPAALVLVLAGLLLATALVPITHRAAVLVASGTLSALLLAMLDRQRNHLTPLALRIAADLVLLCPALLFPTVLPCR
jgi:hypothetical protein